MSLHTRQPEPTDDEPTEATGSVGAGQPRESADGVGSGGRWREPVVLGPGAQVLAALAAVVVLGALIGTGLHHLADQADDPQPRHTPITSGHSPQPTPTPSPSVQPSLSAEDQALKDAALAMPAPERPEGMDKLSPEGARAAAEYFLSLYPYVYATGDLSDWQAMSDAGCVFCNNVITNVTELHSAGGWTDPLQQEVLAVSYGVSDEDPEVWVVTLDVSHPEGTDHDGLGGTSTVNAEDTTFLLQLRWTGQTWIAEEGATR